MILTTCCHCVILFISYWTVPSQGLKASAGYNHVMSDVLMTLHGTCLSSPTWLLQCLRLHHDSCFLQPCSCYSVQTNGLHRPCPCATSPMTLEEYVSVALFKQTKKKAFNTVRVVLALTCLPPCSRAQEVELCGDPQNFNWL